MCTLVHFNIFTVFVLFVSIFISKLVYLSDAFVHLQIFNVFLCLSVTLTVCTNISMLIYQFVILPLCLYLFVPTCWRTLNRWHPDGTRCSWRPRPCSRSRRWFGGRSRSSAKCSRRSDAIRAWLFVVWKWKLKIQITILAYFIQKFCRMNGLNQI